MQEKAKSVFLFNLFFVILFFFASTLNAAEITGKVTTADGTALAYANVFIKGTSKGTTTNIEGKYRLEVTPGTYVVAAKYLGYAQQQQTISIETNGAVLNFILEQENLQIKEVTINAGAEDPAYGIIRQAMKKRKFYLEQVDAYSCTVYIKGLQKMTKYPKKMMGVTIDFGGQLDSTTGIFYLSESVSKLSYKKPNNINEEMVSSRISGNNKAFSFNQASEMMFNFYENIVEAMAISSRGFISPIAPSAMLYYRYELVGTTVENELLVHKIKLSTKRNHDPAFSGFIYIQDSTWRIQSVDVILTKAAGMEFVDTLRIRQMHIPISNDVWMPTSNKFDFDFNFLGFSGGGTYVSVRSDYNLQPVFNKKSFSGEILKVNDDANKRDSTYWQTIRPIPLTLDEKNDYVLKDSIAVVRESKAFKDSLDSISNKFSATQLLLSGYNYRNRYHKMNYSVSSLLSSVQFNTVEGVVVNINGEVSKIFEKRKRFYINPTLRYGFANTHWNVAVGTGYKYNPKRFGEINIKGGSMVSQFNEEEPVSILMNTAYTLLDERNYLKVFEKRFFLVHHRQEIVNGVYATLQSEMAQRIPLSNTTDYTIKDFKERTFSENIPAPVAITNIPLHNVFTATAGLELRIKQKYISRPDIKYISDSKYPAIFLHYTKGFTALNTHVDFDKFRLALKHEIGFGMLGKLIYETSYDQFLQKKKIFSPDLIQANGNKYLFSSFKLNQFNLLDYYVYSSDKNLFQAHGEYHFSGFLFNKIPLLRKLKLDEIAGIHYAKMPGLSDYMELNFGVEKLGFLRFDFVMGFAERKTTSGIRLGIKLRN
jgi:Family of unknown function (DUF5686)/CarboxypepD_reg-like domain